MATTTFTLDDDLEARVEQLADQRGQSVEALMRDAVSDYADRADARRRLFAEAKQAWEELHQTGLHLTEEELFDWLDTWGTPNERPAPDCHD